MARKKCNTCRFACKKSGMYMCQYILIMGHRRGCEPEKCTRYIKGEQIPAPEGDNESEIQKKIRKNQLKYGN